MIKKYILLAIIAVALGFALWALFTGPSLIEIIDNPKY
jgi:hypothetical protein